MLRKILLALLLLVVAGGVVFALGPRVPVDTTVTFDSSAIGNDPEAFLAARESRFDDIRDGLQKEIIWAYPVSKAKTPLAVVYIHGFSASKGEIRPLPDIVARELGANLFYTRLVGHGRDGDAMAEVSVNAWVNDLAEAVAIGRKIGEKVIIIAVSTGGGISGWAASRPSLLPDVAGLVLISPNFGIQAAGTGLMTLPWGETITTLLVGEERSFEPQNDLHAKYWTNRYSSKSLPPLAAMTALANAAPYANATVPVLFVISDEDKVVLPAETRRIAAEWGGPSEILAVTDSDDSHQHVIAGDALSPSTTAPLAAKTIEWIRKSVR